MPFLKLGSAINAVTENRNVWVCSEMSNEYVLFWEPKHAFEKVFSDLKKAKKSIHIETFLFGSDLVGKELIDILAKKSMKIPVTLIVDGYGLQNMNKSFRKKIDESKIKFVVFNPLWQQIRRFNIRRWFRTLPYRNHRKVTIIDGEIAYVGGMNYHHDELKWHDLFSRIKGPIVNQLLNSAREMTKIATRKKTERRKIKKQNTMIYTTKDCITRQIPLSKHRPLKKQLKQILRTAKKEVRMTTPYFIPDPHFHQLLHATTKRGVRIKLIVPRRSDRNVADILTNMNLFIANKAGVEIRFLGKMTHAKYIVADDYMCSFGSSNMDYQSFYNNYELNITSKNKKLSLELQNQFDKDWNKSKPFEINLWNNRSKRRKLMEKILQPFKKYF